MLAKGIILTRAQAAQALGITEDRLVGHVSRGPFSKLPRVRGEYTPADLAVLRATFALQDAVGDRSPRVTTIMEELAPKIWHAVRDRRTEPITLHVATRSTHAGVSVNIHINLDELLAGGAAH